MGRGPFREARFTHGFLEHLSRLIWIQCLPHASKEQSGPHGACFQPAGPQQARMQGGLLFPSTLAEYADHAVIALQIHDLQVASFLNPQPRREHRPEQHSVVGTGKEFKPLFMVSPPTVQSHKLTIQF